MSVVNLSPANLPHRPLNHLLVPLPPPLAKAPPLHKEPLVDPSQFPSPFLYLGSTLRKVSHVDVLIGHSHQPSLCPTGFHASLHSPLTALYQPTRGYTPLQRIPNGHPLASNPSPNQTLEIPSLASLGYFFGNGPGTHDP